jgi:putative oxidoreductase
MNGRAASFGLLVLRLAGFYLAWGHGHGMFMSLMHGEADRFIGGVSSMGFPQPVLFAWLAASAEFLGGLLIFLGLCTRVAAAFVVINMAVAAFLKHHALEQLMAAVGLTAVSKETLEQWGKPEAAILYLLIALALVFTGPGRFSLDGRIGRRMGRDG